jgi:uroporphyrinogen-III synthase
MTLASRTLYLGIDAPSGVFHYPVIRTERIDSSEFQEALAIWERCTHAIFTSKNGVRHWPGNLHGKTIVSIGEATAKEVGGRGVASRVASEATQEGVAALLATLDLDGAFLLYPKSKLARPFLAEYLKAQNLSHYVFDLYDTVFQRPDPVPELSDFDEIIFTSSSTVHAFFQIFSSVPRRIALTPIGPITKKTLEEYGCLTPAEFNLLAARSIGYNANFKSGGSP